MELNSEKIIFLGTDTNENIFEKTDDKVVTIELEKEKKLKEKGIDVISFHRHAQNPRRWSEILQSAEKWWESWSEERIYEEKNIKQILQHTDTSLWWFVHTILWEKKNGVFDTIYQIETLISLIEESNPKTIEVYGKFEFPIIDMLNSLKEKYDFTVLDHCKKTSQIQTNNIITKRRIGLLLRLAILKTVHIFAKKKNGTITIISWNGGTIMKTEKGKKIASDSYFIGLEKFFEKNIEKINFISLNRNLTEKKFTEFLKLLKLTLNAQFETWIIYYTLKGFKNAYHVYKNFKKLFSKMENDLDFINSMKYKDVNLYPFLSHLFQGHLSVLLGFSILEIEAVKNYLKKNNPKVIFTIDGFAVVGGALNYVCNKKKIRVITPQLGMIPVENSINSAFIIKKDFDTRLLPEFFVWGPHFYDLVKNMGYPSTKIKQNGFWRTDTEIISNDSSNYILYISGANQENLQYLQSIEEEIFTIRQIYKIVPKGFKLIVKIHPSLNDEIYFNLLNDLENLDLIGNKQVINVNTLINNSKIIIGKVTTLLIQSMILNKPIIIVNFAGRINFLGFKDIPFATDINEFKKIMDEILNGRLKNQYKINDYCNPVGEKAINNLIKELINS